MRTFEPLPISERQKTPERLSQTLLSKADDCPRSAHLYVKYDGGPASHAAARGTVFHDFAAKATLTLIEQDEIRMPGDVAKALMDETLEQSDEVVPAGEQDGLRAMAWNWAEGTLIESDRVVAVEGLLTAEIGGMTVSGRLDLVEMVDDLTLRVTDYKTSLNLPTQEAFASGFQLPCYAVLLALSEWGQGVQRFVLREVYPRYTRSSGELSGPEPIVYERKNIPDHLAYLERLVARTLRIFTEGNAPAVPGDHCKWCAATAECPIPPVVRGGEVASVEDAQETAENWLVLEETRKELWKQLKGWVSENGPVETGGLVFELSPQDRKTTDLEAVEQALLAGVPVDLDRFIKVSQSTTLRKRAV